MGKAVNHLDIEDLTTRYLEQLGELPVLPFGATYALIADLMEDAIISKIPVDQEEIWERIKENGSPLDIADQFREKLQNP